MLSVDCYKLLRFIWSQTQQLFTAATQTETLIIVGKNPAIAFIFAQL